MANQATLAVMDVFPLRLSDRFASHFGLPGLPGWLHAIAHAPRATGAILPSGQQLSQMMADALPAGPGLVIELGPGTGVITHALLRRRLRAQDLIAIESNPHFAGRLAGQFPSVEIIMGAAERLAQLVDIPACTASAVVSGLPLRNMSWRAHYRILSQAFRLLGADGVFIQFSYGAFCPVEADVLNGLGLMATRIGIAWRNVPPASVWRIERCR